MTTTLDLTILMPCLNEAETLAVCIEKARQGLQRAGVQGEVLIADNGSTDGSVAIAQQAGARVVSVKDKGYGSALRGGIEAAQGRWIIMGDADDSYDFSRIEGFVQKFREGYELVMGCRLPSGGGTIAPGAMPWKNRWIGNPSLSFVGRLFFQCPARDFHCGLRGFTRAAYDQMELQTSGMEFASEMVIKATLKSLKITEVPITLHPDGRSRPPHLKPWRDGWRHLRFMLLYSPRWLFLYPGLFLMTVGGAGMVWLWPGPQSFFAVKLDVHTMLYAAMAVLIGFQAVSFAVISKVFAISAGLLPEDAKLNRLFQHVNLEVGLLAGLGLILAGLGGSIHAMMLWKQASFGQLQPAVTFRSVVPAVLMLVLGCQVILTSFLLSVLGLRRKGSKLK
jgi:glycosyltransferase involved in cell wall biosynthesis